MEEYLRIDTRFTENGRFIIVLVDPNGNEIKGVKSLNIHQDSNGQLATVELIINNKWIGQE